MHFYSAAAVAVGYGAYLVLSFDDRLEGIQRNLTALTQLASRAPRAHASDSAPCGVAAAHLQAARIDELKARIEILENAMIDP